LFALAAFENKGGPISSTSFNHTGRIFAYAVTNDWSGGHMSNKPDFVNKVFLHPCKDEVRHPNLPLSSVCSRSFAVAD
jgi:mRNA export factor